MDWERVLINFGVITGFLALMAFWLGLAMWMRVDADKRGLAGWVWIYVGLLTGPIGLIAYILWRGNRPVLDVVKTRDELIATNARLHTPIDFNPDEPSTIPPEPTPDPTDNIQQALEAEERRYRQN